MLTRVFCLVYLWWAAGKQRSLECDERDTPSEDVSQWTTSTSREVITNDNNKAENEESLSKYAVGLRLLALLFFFSIYLCQEDLYTVFTSADI